MSRSSPARWLAWLLFGCTLLVAACPTGHAHAAARTYVLAVGVNNPAPAYGTKLSALRFADDDAAALFEFLSTDSRRAHLLTVMDPETQALFPEAVQRSRAPTLAGVNAAVRDVATHMRRDRAAGHSTVAIVFFSGHGILSEQGEPALLLADERLTKSFLYDHILERLPADVIHLWVDACHAEAVVRPRDAAAPVVSVSPSEANQYLMNSTLARFPQVGALMAASTDRETHEWDAIKHGVFTYELLSALRGAADVNRDRALEYSEVSAYMAAANRGVAHPGVRLQVVSRAPPINGRAPLVDLSSWKDAAWLLRIPHAAGLVHVSDDRGKRLASVRTSPDYRADVLLPVGRALYVRNGERERGWWPQPGERVLFESLPSSVSTSRVRGSANDALLQGLFSVAYGRGYYLGFTDQRPDFVPVAFAEHEQHDAPSSSAGSRPESESAATLMASLGLGPVVAEELEVAHGMQLGLRLGRGSGPIFTAEGMRAAATGLSEWRGEGAFGFLWALNSGRARAFLGGMLGGGVIHQSSVDVGSRLSGVLSARPIFGWNVEVTERFGSWAAVEYTSRAYRQNGSVTLSFAPSAWLGVAGAL